MVVVSHQRLLEATPQYVTPPLGRDRKKLSKTTDDYTAQQCQVVVVVSTTRSSLG